MAWSRSTRITLLLILDIIFFFIELITGYAVGSLALVADSFHMLNDIISLVIALYAIKLTAGRPVSNDRYSYGWNRAEILAALVNGVFLLALCVSIFLEAISRFFTTPEIENPKLVAIVGAWGLVSNIVGLWLFHEHDHEPAPARNQTASSLGRSGGIVSTSGEYPDMSERTALLLQDRKPKTRSMNMQALVLHVIGDALGNVGVIATGLIIWKTTWQYKYYCDPVISLVITMIIFSSAMPLVKKTSFILLQGVPTTVSLEAVKHAILSVEGVVSLHELHVWQLSESKLVASVHVLASGNRDFMPIAAEIRNVVHKLGIHSCTVQPEYYPSTLVTDNHLKKNRDNSCLVLCPEDESCDPLENACCPPYEN